MTGRYICWSIILVLGIIWIFTVSSTSIYSIEPSDLGLASKMPHYFWIGLALLALLFYIGKDSKKYLSTALIFLILYLFAAPIFIKEPVWISNSFYPFAESILINESGHLVDRPSALLQSYMRWPLFLFFSSILMTITAIPHIALLKFFPLFTISFYGLLVFLILRVKLGFHHVVFGTACFLSGFWFRQQYFGPQSLAYAFFLALLLIVSRLFFGNGTEKRKLMILLFFLSIVICITHLLTTVMSAIVLIALYFAQRLIIKSRSCSIEICIFISIIFLAYTLLVSEAFFSFLVNRVYSSLSRIMNLSIYHESRRIIGSPANMLNYVASWSIVLLNILLAIPLIILALRDYLLHGRFERREFEIFCASFLCLLGIFAFTMRYGPHEAYQRAFMFGLMPLTYMFTKFLKTKPKIMAASLAILIFLSIPAQYGSDSFRLAASSQLAGAKFTAFSLPNGSSCFTEFSLYIRYYSPLKSIRFTSLVTSPATSFPDATKVGEVIGKTRYIVLSDLQEKYFLYYLGRNPLNQINLDEINRIYDNKDFLLLGKP